MKNFLYSKAFVKSFSYTAFNCTVYTHIYGAKVYTGPKIEWAAAVLMLVACTREQNVIEIERLKKKTCIKKIPLLYLTKLNAHQ